MDRGLRHYVPSGCIERAIGWTRFGGRANEGSCRAPPHSKLGVCGVLGDSFPGQWPLCVACRTARRFGHRRPRPAQPRRRAATTTGPAPASGTDTSLSFSTSPPNNAKPTSLEFRRPARLTVKSSARPIPRIPISLSGPKHHAPFFENDPRFQQAIAGIAHVVHAPLIVNGIGSDLIPQMASGSITSRRWSLRTTALR